MAQLTFSIAEIVDLVIANEIIPTPISNIKLKGDIISFKIKTGLMIPNTIQATLSYQEFDKGVIRLKLATGWLADKLLKIFPLPNHEYIDFDFPIIQIYAQRILEQKIKGIKIEDIIFKNGKFTILTQNI